MRVSVIIPTYNRAADLSRCLRALTAQTLCPEDFEILVVDDGSQDATPELVRSAGTSRHTVRYLAQRNQGPAAARNLGILSAESDLIAFLDDDCLPEPDCLGKLLAALPDEPRCAGMGGLIVRLRDSRIGRFIDTIGMLHHGKRGAETLYLVTANALFRKAALLDVGGFERQIAWPGGEDCDLSDRLRARGYYLGTTELAVTGHNHRDTVRGLYATFRHYGRGEAWRARAGRKTRVWHRNRIFYLIACLGHFVVDSARILVRPRLRLADRLAFCFLRLIANAGIFVGYATFPGVPAPAPGSAYPALCDASPQPLMSPRRKQAAN